MDMDILADMEKENIYDSYEEARDEIEIAEARRKRRIRFVGIGIAVLVMLSLLIGGVSALCDNMQNHPSDNLSLYYGNEICTTPWENTSDHNFVEGHSSVDIVYNPYTDTKAIKFRAWISASHNGAWGRAKIKSTIPEVINYFSFTTRSNSNYVWVSFYDSDNTLINTSNNLGSYISANDSCEFLKSGNSVGLYVNGTYKCNIGGIYNRTPYYVELAGAYRSYWDHGITSISHYYDDFFTSSEEGIMGTVEHNSLVYRNVDNPISSIYFINTSYAWKTREAGISLDPADSLITKYTTTGEVVNTTVPNASKPCGIIKYNISDMLYHDNWQDDNYGYYYQELKRGSSVLATDYFFYMYVVSGASTATINWDKDSYISGQTAQVNWSITDEDFTDYTYKGSVWSLTDPTTTKHTWTISATSGTENVDLGGYETDTYFVVLTMRDKSIGHDYDIAGDIMALNEEIWIEGITYNAETEAVLGTVNASFLQGAQYYNATSNASTGEYNASGLSVDIETEVNATKTNYTHNDFSFTPLQVDSYKLDIFMLPNISYISYHNTSIGGLVQSSPFFQNVSGATVNIWNLSWSDNATANSMGYYIFENLTNGTYSINATCAGYLASSDEEVETNNGSFLYHYILLEPQFVLTVKASDASTHATITDFTAIVNDGMSQDTTNGSIGFTVGYGIHKVEASAEGYYASLEYVYVDEDTEKIMYLTPLETVAEGGAGVYYPPPHLVRFFVQDIYTNPKLNVEVTATCIQTTMGSWDWLYSIFGFKNETQLEETEMNGTTDSAGGISFMMVETIKYNLHFVNATQDIDENLTIYPKSDRYTVIVGRTGFFDVEPQLFGEQINWNFTMDKINTTAAWLNFTYNDTLSQTMSGSYYVFMVNETTGVEKINMSNVTYYCSTPQSFNSSGGVWYYNCTVHDYRGNTYILGFNATHMTAGEFKEAVSVFFRYNHPLIQFAGWDEHPGYYQFLSIALLIFAGMLFTGVTLKIGAVLLPLFAFLLFGIGWFSPTDDLVTSGILLGIAAAIGIAVYVTTTGREKNLAS